MSGPDRGNWEQPWTHLVPLLECFHVEPVLFGFAYVLTGRLPPS